MAVEDFGGKVLGKPIEVIFADHQNKADIGANKAREWFDTGGVDMINDLNNSGVALAVAAIAKEKKRHIIVNGSSNVGITNQMCSPYAVHYAYDAYSLAQGTGQTTVERAVIHGFPNRGFRLRLGLEQQVSDIVRAAKGRVVGAARHPLGTTTIRPTFFRRRHPRPKSLASLPPARMPPTPSKRPKSWPHKKPATGCIALVD